MNKTILVGRLVKAVEFKVNEKGRKEAKITLAITRNYKNEYGLYDTDLIDITLWDAVAKATLEYCKKGDIIGINARIETVEDNDKRELKLIADKVTFLSAAKGEVSNDETI